MRQWLAPPMPEFLIVQRTPRAHALLALPNPPGRAMSHRVRSARRREIQCHAELTSDLSQTLQPSDPRAGGGAASSGRYKARVMPNKSRTVSRGRRSRRADTMWGVLSTTTMGCNTDAAASVAMAWGPMSFESTGH